MILRPKLELFLRTKGLYNRVITIIKEQDGEITSGYYRSLDTLFVFADTKEGHSYWRHLDDKSLVFESKYANILSTELEIVLRRKGELTKFIKYCKVYATVPLHEKVLPLQQLIAWFVFSTTPETHDFWQAMHKELGAYLSSLKDYK